MKPFNHQLDPALVSKSHQLDQLTSLISSELPPETDGHYHVAGIDNSTLVIITDSPVWTTRLRQLGPAIIQALSGKTGKQFQHVRIVSRHGSIKAPEQPDHTVNRVLSEKSGQQIAQSAEHIKDEDLREALIKFSKRSKKLD